MTTHQDTTARAAALVNDAWARIEDGARRLAELAGNTDEARALAAELGAAAPLALCNAAVANAEAMLSEWMGGALPHHMSVALWGADTGHDTGLEWMLETGGGIGPRR